MNKITSLIICLLFALTLNFYGQSKPSFDKAKINVTNFRITKMNDYVEKVFFEYRLNQNQLHKLTVLIKIDTRTIYFIMRENLQGTVSFAVTPYVLLQCQRIGMKTDSISKLSDSEKPYIFFMRNDTEVEIYEDQSNKLDKMFEFFQKNAYKNTDDLVKLLEREENYKLLIFEVNKQWFWNEKFEIM